MFRRVITRADIESVDSNAVVDYGEWGKGMYVFNHPLAQQNPQALRHNESILKSPTPHSPMSSRRLVPKVSNDVSLTRFLVRDRRSAVLPPPPPTSPIPKENAWLTDVDVDPGEYEIMDGRLHDLYDAGHVKAIFSQLRERETSTLLETGVYNALIEMHFGMATQKELENQDSWLGEVFDLYEILDSGAERVAPHSITYRLCSCSVPGYTIIGDLRLAYRKVLMLIILLPLSSSSGCTSVKSRLRSLLQRPSLTRTRLR